MNKKTIVARLAALFILIAGLALPAVSAAALTCQVDPTKVDINLDYHGAILTVTGQSDAGDDLIVRIGNEPGEAHYKYMGKAGGVFWMKKGDVSFKNVPGVYLLYTTTEMDKLLDEKAQKANDIGYADLKEGAEVETSSPEVSGDPVRWKNEFIRFKEKQNLYAIKADTVTLQKGQAGDTYKVEVNWPYQAPPGAYMVQVMAVRGGQVVDRAEAGFTVERAGVVAQLSGLAFNQSALYGIMAVVVAIIAGFAVGMIFKKGGGAH